EPRGINGFGYDPIFHLPSYGKTMAELPASVKNRISHRGKAAREAKKALKRLARTRPQN
ncbi:MAG: non-canonical purine NTP pyrophosphatase, partial [Chloroflexi bacterium]|nr:non-canonical purine NTP pyrophosphatase [Chloroflexota bacterium]